MMNIRKYIQVSTLMLALLVPIPAANAHTHELVTAFGPFAEGPGHTALGVSALAVDLETGNVYVVDPNTKTIDIFDATGGKPADGVPTTIPFEPYNPGFAFGDVAVDNSCYEHQPRLNGKACEEYDPSYGDVYVVYEALNTPKSIRRYRLNSKHEYELVGELIDPFQEFSASGLSFQGIDGLAVDPRGNLYLLGGIYYPGADSYVEVPYGSGQPVSPAMIVEFKKILTEGAGSGAEEIEEKIETIPIRQKLIKQWQGEMMSSLAVDGRGDLYVGQWKEGSQEDGKAHVLKLGLDEANGVVSEELFGSVHFPTPVAVEPLSGTVYVGYSTEVQEYNAAGEPGLVFGSSEPLGGSLGKEFQGAVAIAVDGPAGLIYVANRHELDVDVFGQAVELPVVEGQQPPAAGVTQTGALVQGSADPESTDGGSYYFEYVPAGDYEQGGPEPYREGGRTPVESLAGGHAAELTGQVAVTGLLPGTLYHYRLAVHNESGTVYGPDETFTTVAGTPPVASTGPALNVSAMGAVLTGSVAAQGLSTSYVFEVGTSTNYEGARLFGSAGSGTGTVSVSAALEYLVPGTTYHYRLSAMSFDGSGQGQDGTFTTPGISSSIVQPVALALLGTPTVQFPSIAGAITHPAGKKPRKKTRRKAHAHGKRRSTHRVGVRRGRRVLRPGGGGARR